MTPLIDKSQILRLAERASDFYIEGKVANLSAAVVDTLGDDDYNKEQVARVVEATNQAVWNKLSSAECPHKVRFEPASLVNVLSLKKTDEVGVEKTAAVGEMEKTAAERPPAFLETIPMNRLEEILFPEMKKVAGETPDPFAIPPEETADWDRVAAKVAAAKAQLRDQLDTSQIGFHDAVNSLVKVANQELLEGSTEEEVTFVVLSADPHREVGPAMVEVLSKTAFARQNLKNEDFDSFIARGQLTDEGRPTVWDPFEKTASVPERRVEFPHPHGHTAVVPLRDDQSSEVNTEHPVYQSVVKIAELREKSLLLTEAVSYLDERLEQAQRFALEGKEVPAHV